MSCSCDRQGIARRTRKQTSAGVFFFLYRWVRRSAPQVACCVGSHPLPPSAAGPLRVDTSYTTAMLSHCIVYSGDAASCRKRADTMLSPAALRLCASTARYPTQPGYCDVVRDGGSNGWIAVNETRVRTDPACLALLRGLADERASPILPHHELLMADLPPDGTAHLAPSTAGSFWLRSTPTSARPTGRPRGPAPLRSTSTLLVFATATAPSTGCSTTAASRTTRPLCTPRRRPPRGRVSPRRGRAMVRVAVGGASGDACLRHTLLVSSRTAAA